jgi:hypothetical protein
MAESYPPNTHDLDVRVRVTLPAGETVAEQDVALLLTGDDFDPWPGVEIHEVDLLAHRPAEVVALEGRDRLSTWFGLGRASFLTLPRVLMEAMPDHWQGRMAALLEEYNEAFPHQPDIGSRVQITQDGKLIKTPAWLLNYRHPDQAAIDALRANRD